MKSKYLNFDYSKSDINLSDLKKHIKNMSKIINAYALKLERTGNTNYAYTAFKSTNKDLLTAKGRVKGVVNGDYTYLRKTALKYQSLIGKRKSISELEEAKKNLIQSFRKSESFSVKIKDEKKFLQFIESGAFESYKRFVPSEEMVEAYDYLTEIGIQPEDILKAFDEYSNNEIDNLTDLYGKFGLSFFKVKKSKVKR